MTAAALIKHTRELAADCDALTFAAPVTHTYNPLIYARAPHEIYLRQYAATRKKTIFIGMNPGPWGMAQTGVPFGDVASVRDFLNINAPVAAPAGAHPKRPVLGFKCPRGEVSGQRLWRLFKERYGSAADFFADNFVLNYCPLLFLAQRARGVKNLTPDNLPAAQTAALFGYCDGFLRRACFLLGAENLVGVGQFAKNRIQSVFGGDGVRVASILHPSPASPAANRDFFGVVNRQLDSLQI